MTLVTHELRSTRRQVIENLAAETRGIEISGTLCEFFTFRENLARFGDSTELRVYLTEKE